ncbi:MAG: inositol monophosphatase [Dehalococcoidia bacterium]|nr:inositol monophosphatase [Dehalococcoidia bacterium]
MAAGVSSIDALPPLPAEAILREVEALAVELARAAGAEAQVALGRTIGVAYKSDRKGKEDTNDPVSEVDHAVEAIIRERVGAQFPGHAIIGEEVETHPTTDTEWVWVVDPVDGTANFVNGFPLFAVSIGVLHHGRPVVGAIWCASTPALRAGVYHAHLGGTLALDGVEVGPRTTVVKRRLAAAPGGSPGGTREWDHRVTGSAALECAYVAAGIFTSVPFWGLKLWDVAAGVALVRAAGLEAWTREGGTWQPLERFVAPAKAPKGQDRAPSLRDWRAPLVLGTAGATRLIRERQRPPSLLMQLRWQLMGRRR